MTEASELADIIPVSALLAWIEWAWPRTFHKSDFNDGVIRGFEIIQAQLREGHVQRFTSERPDMSKVGNHRIGVQETDDYRFGWESAERGEPSPEWFAETPEQRDRLAAQRLGWNDCFAEARHD